MKIYLVGGAVRDKLLNIEVYENDWVVVGASENELTSKGYKKIGKDFPVFLHPETKEEYALARKERKSGTGHKGFKFKFDSSVSLEEDLLRRDLTVNAIAKDSNGELIDPYNGIEDLNNRILRKVSSAFEEDPLRVLRVARFASKLKFLGFEIEDETLNLMSKISSSGEIETLSKERIWLETSKALSTKNPEVFFSILDEVGCLQRIVHSVSMNLKALEDVSKENEDLAIRWSAAIVENENLEEINVSFNAPKEFGEVSLVCRNLRFFYEQDLSPNSVMELIHKADFLRKPDRFLRAEKASQYIDQDKALGNEFWKQIHKLLIDIQADPSLKEGKLIAKKLHQDRLAALKKFLSNI